MRIKELVATLIVGSVPQIENNLNRFRKSFAIAVVSAGVLMGGSVAHGQGIVTGTLVGSVQDATGAVITGAKITVTKTDTNTVFTTTTNAQGSFTLSDLPVGNYGVKIEDQGFTTLEVKDLHVDANRTQSLGIEKLSTGALTSTVEVNASQVLLETTQAQVSTTFSTQQVSELPVGGGFDELAVLIPGVVATHSANYANTNGTGISSNGQRGRANNFEIDGQANNDNSVTGPQFFFGNEEAIDQVQIITNNFSAAYGRNMGSVVNYITKSGSNSYHGSAFYRYSGNFTSSLETGVSKGAAFGFCAPGENPSDGCTVPVVPRYVYNLYGGNFTAPIWKDKIFASFGIYGTREFENGGATASTPTVVPSQAGLQMLNNLYPNNKAVAILNQLNPFMLQGNPHAIGAPVMETVSDGVTSASVPFTQIARNFPSSFLDREYLGRLDFQLTNKDHLSGRYIYQNDPTIPDNPTATGGTINVTAIVHAIGADLVHTFSPRWVDQLRYSFQQSTLAFEGGDFPNCTITNFATCPSQISLGGNFAGYGLANNLPQGRIVKTGQVQDNATWSFGRHTITFGGEFDYQNSPNTFLPASDGILNFSGGGANSFNSFLQGAGTVILAQGSPLIPFKENDVAVYFQDDWKVSPEFTANLGVRWEFFQQALNLLNTESVAQQTGAHPIWDTALPLSQTTFPRIPQSYRNVEPRIGFAYNPNYARNLVVRGGFAINVDPGFYNINLNAASSAPVVNTGSFTCNGTAGPTVPASCLPTGGANFTTVAASLSQFVPTGGNPGLANQDFVGSNFRQPLAETYTLGVQYQVTRNAVAEVRYTGNHTMDNFQVVNSNPYLLPVATDFPNVVAPSSLCTAANSTLAGGADIGHLQCGSTIVNTVGNTAFSIYNALQSSLTVRNNHGITATFGYTYSRTIDNVSEIFGNNSGAGNESAYAQNPLDTNVGERGVSNISYPNAASIAFTYALPKIGTSDRGLVGRLVNGWQMNSIWIYNSGQPFSDYDTVTNSSPQVNPNDPKTFTSYSDSNFATNEVGFDTERPIVSNPKAPIGTVGIYTTVPTGNGSTNSAPMLVDYSTGAPVAANSVHWIANNQYAAQLAGTPYPGSGRNLLRGDTFNNVDLNFYKNTNLTERVSLRIEADAYNVLNRSYYGLPDGNLGHYPSGTFNNFSGTPAQAGGLVGVGTGVRNMTFGAKILF
jgi:Carboxypeptidase regulatory-like domain/TonB-dependent Receptor Plug Domain